MTYLELTSIVFLLAYLESMSLDYLYWLINRIFL